jgi:hypothetical protein
MDTCFTLHLSSPVSFLPQRDKILREFIRRKITKNLAGLFLRVEDPEMKLEAQNKILEKLEREIKEIGKRKG